ncbi:MAG: hypothetical protein QNI86_14905 [Halieaceae bacterium]|nr:hypothetical protein [Halieaceae bacterium]
MTEAVARFKWDTREVMKVTIYALLLVNFGLYMLDDIEAASHEMRNGGTLLDWMQAFATTIDESAWFVLLLLFELETHVLSDEIQERPWVVRLVHGVRLFCILFLAHSVYAFWIIYWDLAQAEAVQGATHLCQLLGQDLSFVRNVEYSVLTGENCNTLSTAGQFFYTEPGLVVSDAEGLAIETRLALVDWLEVVIWLLILATIEIMVRLQDRGITRGRLVTVIKGSKLVLYTCLWAMAAWWASLGHYYYAWDETLWIIGFIAIESNMNEWKKEIEAKEAGSAAPGLAESPTAATPAAESQAV